MAPGDRQERRQQRVRGAGASSVQTSFGFDLAALAPRAKQASAPPRSRRTPTPSQKTPRSLNSSARRHRSASVHRSSSSKRHITPKQRTITPQTGKRKRGSKHAETTGEDDGEVDDLSPDHDKDVRSIEKSRRVAGAVSPIREEADEVPDELSFMDDGAGSVRKVPADSSILSGGTPAIVPTKTSAGSKNVRDRTPIADRVGNKSVSSRQAIAQRSKSFEPPITPDVLPDGRPRFSSASHLGPSFTTPGAQQEEDSEDELTPRINDVTPRVVAIQQTEALVPQEDGEMDELSSPAQPIGPSPIEIAPAKRGRPKRVILDEEYESQAAPPAPAPAKRGRPKQVLRGEGDDAQAAPSTSQPRRKRMSLDMQERADDDEAPDEISPQANRTERLPAKKVHRAKGREKQPEKQVIEVSSAEESDNYEPEEEEEDIANRASRPASKPKQKPAKLAKGGPPRKRQHFGGPKQAISVMRIKGSTVRGVTAADTTRTILEQSIDHQVSRMAEKLQTTQDSTRRKHIRGEINLALAFKESLSEKLLDLQDANDTLSSGFKKRKVLRTGNIERRKEIIAIQNSRQEVALELDDEQALFDSEKAKADEKNKLSANLFEIQAAIQSGRQLAKRQGREDEGPELPLSMLLEGVGRDVGSEGGGLLSVVGEFNSGLEKAAGWLEGRA